MIQDWLLLKEVFLAVQTKSVDSFFSSTYIYGDKICSWVVWFIKGDIHWSLFIGFISYELSMGSSSCFFLAGYTCMYIWSLVHRFT